ncbi:type II secretion system F family protein [Dactylosporangium sp. NPDC051541]|uniref:type II secretion system F family protein n=1 Tax=Dactylosporangium sp. NPDC051541 TaxID=3363977 RepID=UPI003790C01F
MNRLLGWPVASVIVAVYCLLALLALHHRIRRRDSERDVARLIDAVDATAEGLRAGALPDGSAVPALAAGSDRTLAVARGRLAAAYRLSEHLGVPLADLLERVEADLRAGQALRGEMAAQLAGAQTSTVVLLPLPLIGLWVGSALGADPAQQLLHTTLGAACALTACGLQCGGLLWTGRMVRAATAEVRR